MWKDCPTNGKRASHLAMNPLAVSFKMKISLPPFDVSWIRPEVMVVAYNSSIVRDSDFEIATTKIAMTTADDDDDNHLGNTSTNHPGGLQPPLVQSGTTSVKSFEFNHFRVMLIDNFNIAFHEDELKWPKRFEENTRPPVPILASKYYQ